jgi:uncharacterized membrane protein (UPF0127 family)
MLLRNVSNGSVLATDVSRATNAWSRGIGLLGHATVAPHVGLWIDGCSAVHTIGMRATIDLFFLDRDMRILKISSAVRPNRLAVTCRNAVCIVELGTGGEVPRDVLVGDRLALE